MLKFKKLFICLVLSILLISPSVLATNENEPLDFASPDNSVATQPVEDIKDVKPESIKQDLYIYDTTSYSLDDIVDGNIFSSAMKFTTNPRNNGGIVSGNMYLISDEVVIESDVIYSNNKDSNGKYVIDSVNSTSTINGNMFVCSDSFTLEAGSKINGDLYLASSLVNIEQGAIINGNVFIIANDINLNGQIAGSAYITSSNFNMYNLGYITRDLYINSQNVNLEGVITRDAFITAYGKLSTKSTFKVSRNLSVNYADDFTFSGEVQGDAVINAKVLSFKTDDNGKCLIRGNLKYGTEKETKIPDGIVSGKVSTSKYKMISKNKETLTSLGIKFLTFLVYVFAVVFLAKRFAPKAIEKLPELNTLNILKSLGLGFASFFAIFTIFICLILLLVGTSLAFFAVIAYLFVVGLAMPLFLNAIAGKLKFQLNEYVKLLLVVVITFVISLIPTVGSAVIFVGFVISIGHILLALFRKKD